MREEAEKTLQDMTLGSLFDGSGGFPLAGTLCGIRPVWASEIEPYPLRVTAARFPRMRQLGDVTRIDGAAIPPVDVITFGSPCQDMSTAGKRAGMLHSAHGAREITRSGLFYEAVRIIAEMRRATNGRFPQFAVWENVPGAFTSNGGEDFRAVLESLARIADDAVSVPRPPRGRWAPAGEIVADGYSLAWRTLDAQYWGVPQRRRRIYLVADFAGQRAGQILFERTGLRGHPAQGGEARTQTSADAGGSAPGNDTSGRCQDVWPEAFHTLTAANCRNAESAQRENCVCYTQKRFGEFEAAVGNITSDPRASKSSGNILIFDARGNGGGGTAVTLTGDHEGRISDYTNILCMATAQANAEIESDLSPTILHGHEHPFIVRPSSRRYTVRRLTPLECCRLQGFPDWWEHGVEGSDTARYRMWGNGIALPCARYVLEGVAQALRSIQREEEASWKSTGMA